MNSAIEAGKAFVAIFAKDETKKELKQIGARFKAWGAGIAATGGAMVAASGAVLTGMAAAVNEFSKVGSDLTDMSGRTGVAASALSELGYAAGQSGASMADLEVAMKTMARKTGKSGEEAFLAQAEAISKIEDPGKRAQAAMAVFGKSGTKLLPMLEGGAAGIQKMREEARLMGITMSNEDAAAADKLGDAISMLTGTFRGIALQVGAAVAPLVKFAVDALQPIATTIVRIIKENRGLVQGIAIGVAIFGALGSALVVAGGFLAGVGALLAALPSIVAGVSAAIGVVTTVIGAIISPIGLAVIAVAALVAGLVALGAWFLTSTDAGRGFAAAVMVSLGQLWEFASKTFKGIADALAAGNLALAGKVAMAALNVAWTAGIAGLMEAWAGFATFFVSTITNAVRKAASVMDGMVGGAVAGINALLAERGLATIPTGNIPSARGAADAVAGLGAGIKGGTDAKLAKAQADAAKAVEEFNASLKEAADGKAAVEKAAKLPTLDLPTIAAMKSSMAGTFSGFAAGLLGRAGGASPEERTAKGVEKLVDKMDDLIDKVDDIGGVEFAGVG